LGLPAGAQAASSRDVAGPQAKLATPDLACGERDGDWDPALVTVRAKPVDLGVEP
jgi:hypothetical protein